jgi:hypothetical protein
VLGFLTEEKTVKGVQRRQVRSALYDKDENQNDDADEDEDDDDDTTR